MTEVTRILSRIESGDPCAAGQLLPLIYDELRSLAKSKLAREQPGHTFQATALVHETYIRLVDGRGEPNHWDGRGHFFAAAAEAMRRILVESARRKNRFRHGGDLVRVDFDEFNIEAPEAREDLLALDAALTKLKLVDGTASELVQLRYFAGLTLAEAAEILDISPRTADRIWAYARAWLHREVQQTGEFWQTESFDHLIRSPEQFERFQSYIAENGREAGLGDGVYLHWRRPK